MKLYVEMVDTARIAIIGEPATRRIVMIELTPEQEKLITPLETGSSGGNKYYEEVRPLSIQK